MAKKGSKRRPLAERAAAAELEARRLAGLAKAGEDENVKNLLAAVRYLSRIRTFGKPAVDNSLKAAAGELNKMMQALGL